MEELLVWEAMAYLEAHSREGLLEQKLEVSFVMKEEELERQAEE